MKKIILLLFVFITNLTISQNIQEKKKLLLQKEIKGWQYKDPYKDTLLGISLDRAYTKLIKKTGKNVIVAVLDTDVKIDHEDLSTSFFYNKKEIPNNNLDDDHNGYVDDVLGWNFLGNKKGESIIYENYESTRIIRILSKKFKKGVPYFENIKDSVLYYKSIEDVKKFPEYIEESKNSIDFYTKGYPKALKTAKEYFPNEKYTLSQLDSLYPIVRAQDKEKSRSIYFIRDVLKYGYSQQWFDNFSSKVNDQIATTYNENFYDRSITGDDEENINDKFYGNNDVSKNAFWEYHSTQVSGIIAARRSNNLGIKGISDNIKILPITVVGIGGSEHDKDVALGIRYAVDNGAKVINMSFGKSLSLHSEWVNEAILYAQSKDVLIIVGAGNDAEDNDININNYPNDFDENTGKEFCDNFIVVGASTIYANKNLIARFSSYGKKNVDVFAPGYYLYTTDASDFKYVYNDGTSLATAIASGVGALVRSHYPKLTASQVKQILLDSSVKFDLDVQVPGEKEGTLKPFSELSKSGGVINAYNALLMAKQIANQKR